MKIIAFPATFLMFAMLAASAPASTLLGSQVDDEDPGLDPSLDIVAASITQDGGRVTFSMQLRGPLPSALPLPDDTQTYLWLIDTDSDPATGQSHDGLGSEFNVRAVIGQTYGGGWADVTGSVPGGGDGVVAIDGNTITITVWLGQVGDPDTFAWRCTSFSELGGAWAAGNAETAIASASTLPFTPCAHATVVTPILELCPTGPATGQLQVVLRDAAGNVLPNAEHGLTFHSTNEAVATVDANGLVTAITPPTEHWQTPYIEVWADGMWADNAAVIRVNDVDVGVTHQTYAGTYVSFYVPPVVEGVDLEALMAQYQMVEATDLAWLAGEQAMGINPNHSATDWLVLDVASNPATSVCGASGNPMRFGWTTGYEANNSCFIINDPGWRRPHWFVIWHELGHNFTTSCNAFNMFLWTASQEHNTTYSEGLASLSAMYAWRRALEYSTSLGPLALGDIDNTFCDTWGGFQSALADYRAGGRDYDTINPDILDGILMELWSSYGMKCWYDLFSTFLPVEAPIPVAIDTPEKQATWFVAAMSASTGQDLRDMFVTEYGFPIDASAWDEIHAVVSARIAARDFHTSGLGDPLPSAPAGNRLWPVAPNPFNPRTTFGFTLARDARVALAVYDVRGRLVRRVLDEALEAGAHPGRATWDGNDDQGRAAPSGTYFLRMKTADGFSAARKMTLLR